MKKYITIFLVLVILGLVGYLRGLPIGYQKGRIVIFTYHFPYCSDYCPPEVVEKTKGSWGRIYFGVKSMVECEKIGGRSKIDSAWGNFLYCEP